MIEYLAIPAWNTPAQPLTAWVDGLTEAGAGAVAIRRESGTICWLLIPALQAEGYVELEEGRPAAINFEVRATDSTHALSVLTAAARSVGWEIHEEDEDDRSDEYDVTTRDSAD